MSCWVEKKVQVERKWKCKKCKWRGPNRKWNRKRWVIYGTLNLSQAREYINHHWERTLRWPTTVTAKANHSRQKQINSMRYFYPAECTNLVWSLFILIGNLVCRRIGSSEEGCKHDIYLQFRNENTEIRKSKGGEGGVNRCPSVESSNALIKAEQTDLRYTKYCHKTREQWVNRFQRVWENTDPRTLLQVV